MELETLNQCDLCSSKDLKPFDAECNLWECGDCGYIFDSPRPAFHEINAFYSQNDHYDIWLEKLDLRKILWKRRMSKVEQYGRSGKLLDIGCGIGEFLNNAKDKFDVTGTEISSCAVQIAEERYGLKIIEGEVENAEFDEQFDVITMFHVLEHVPSPSKTIDKVKELIKPGGLLILAVPNDSVGLRPLIVKTLKLFRIGKFVNFGKKGLPTLSLDGTLHEIHLSHFRSHVLESFLNRNGFNVIENSLDPWWVAGGIKNGIHQMAFDFFSIIRRLTGKNYYLTTWIAAQKQ